MYRINDVALQGKASCPCCHIRNADILLKEPDLNLVLGYTSRTLQATVMCCEFRMFCSRLKVMRSEVQEGKVLQNLCGDTAMAVELVRTTFMTSLYLICRLCSFLVSQHFAPSQKRMHINFARLEGSSLCGDSVV